MAEDIEGLENLLAETEEFTQSVFDWVGELGKTGFLAQCYDFKQAVEDRLREEIKNAEIRAAKERQAEEEEPV